MEKKSILDLAIAILRLALGSIFLFHGTQRLFGVFGGSGIEGLSAVMAQMSINPPLLWAWVVILIEVVAGLFIILGILPRISAGLIFVITTMAVTGIHGAATFFTTGGGFEYQVLIAAVSLALVFMGAGKISIFNKL